MTKDRALTKDTKRWAKGWYCEVQGRHFIILDDAELPGRGIGDYLIRGFVEVIPETVGQSTGLKDKHGKEIFEGDIVKVLKKELVGHFHGDAKTACNVFIRYVIWDSKNAQFVFKCAGGFTYSPNRDLPLEIIGNVHQPELKEVSDGSD